MANKEEKINLELLGEIEQVDAPPFLFTRIQQRIENLQLGVDVAKPVFVWSLMSVLIVVLVINVVSISGSNSSAPIPLLPM